MSKSRKKRTDGYLRTAISRSAKLAEKLSSAEIAEELRVDELRILNRRYKQIDYGVHEENTVGLVHFNMTQLYKEAVEQQREIRIVKGRSSKRGSRTNAQGGGSSFKAKVDAAGAFVWQANK